MNTEQYIYAVYINGNPAIILSAPNKRNHLYDNRKDAVAYAKLFNDKIQDDWNGSAITIDEDEFFIGISTIKNGPWSVTYEGISVAFPGKRSSTHFYEGESEPPGKHAGVHPLPESLNITPGKRIRVTIEVLE